MEANAKDCGLYEFKGDSEYLLITDLIPHQTDPEIASRVIGSGDTTVSGALPFNQADTFANLAVGLTNNPVKYNYLT